MTRFMKYALCALLLPVFFGAEAKANTIPATSCSESAVSTAFYTPYQYPYPLDTGGGGEEIHLC